MNTLHDGLLPPGGQNAVLQGCRVVFFLFLEAIEPISLLSGNPQKS